MKAAAKSVLGFEVRASNNYLGLDEVEERNPELTDDYLEFRYIPRHPAYRARQRRFQERLEYLRSLDLRL